MKLRNFLFIIFSLLFLHACSQSGKQAAVPSEPFVLLLQPVEFQQKLLAEKGTLLDVRTPSEYKKGHLQNAVLLDIFSDNFEHEIDKLDKNTPYFVYCGSGGRSEEASQLMHKKGFKRVYDMDGGIAKWRAMNLPVEQ